MLPTPHHHLSCCRLATPLGDEAAVAVGKALGIDHMIERVARARRRAFGAMFPSQLPASMSSFTAGGGGNRSSGGKG